MAQLTEILEIERKRDVQTQVGIIYLYQEGSFLRAYEWSEDSEQTMAFIRLPGHEFGEVHTRRM